MSTTYTLTETTDARALLSNGKPVTVRLVSAGQVKPAPARPASAPKVPTTCDLLAGYRVEATGQANLVRVLRPTDAPERPEHAAGVENGYLVSVGLDGIGAITGECLECAAASCGKRCRHARLVEGIAAWVMRIKNQSSAPLNAPVFVCAYAVPKDPGIAADFAVEVLVLKASEQSLCEYVFARAVGDNGPGFESVDGTAGSALRQVQINHDRYVSGEGK